VGLSVIPSPRVGVRHVSGQEEAAGQGAEANEGLTRAEALAYKNGVVSTPTWVTGGQRVSGPRSRPWFDDWAAMLIGPSFLSRP
jgi:hypothetical protein